MHKKITLVLLWFVGTVFTMEAQKKKDLLDEIAMLKDSITNLNDSISKASRQVNVSVSKAALFEKENVELRDANATLLKNLSSFSQISKQNTETVNKALASLKAKEGQLQFITDNFSQNDSTAIGILTQAKQTLGPDAKIGISNGDVIISNSMDFLFENDQDTTLTEAARTFLPKVAQILIANPGRQVFVEGLNITGEFGLTYQQSFSVANALMTAEGIKPENLNILVKDGNFKEGINIRLTSNKEEFYAQLKEEFK